MLTPMLATMPIACYVTLADGWVGSHERNRTHLLAAISSCLMVVDYGLANMVQTKVSKRRRGVQDQGKDEPEIGLIQCAKHRLLETNFGQIEKKRKLEQTVCFSTRSFSTWSRLAVQVLYIRYPYLLFQTTPQPASR